MTDRRRRREIGLLALLAAVPLFVVAEASPPTAALSGARGDSRSDDTAALQAAIDAAGRTGGVVRLPTGQYRVTTLTLRAGVTLEGAGWDPTDPEKGSVILGTTGRDVLTLPETSGIAYNFALRTLAIEGGRNQLLFPADPEGAKAEDTGYAYVKIHDVRFARAEEACIRVRRHLEELYVSQSVLQGSRWGFYAEPSTSFFDKSTFRETLVSGMRQNAYRIEVPYSTTVTWDNAIINNSGEHGIYADSGAHGWVFTNLNTEGNGMSGKSDRTTGSIAAGSTSLVLTDARGYAIGDTVTVQGAGPRGIDLEAHIMGKRGAALALSTAAASSVKNAGVTNAVFDDVFIAGSIARAIQLIFVGGVLGGEGLHGHLRYGINAARAQSVTLIGTDVFNAATSADDIAVNDPARRVTQVGGKAALRRARDGSREKP